MEGNLRADIDLSMIASISFLSPFHLLRLFKQAFGETPHQYLTRRRLEHAHDLLTTTDLPVWKIGQRVGYDNLSSFSRLVSKHLGAAPRELRRRLRHPDRSDPKRPEGARPPLSSRPERPKGAQWRDLNERMRHQ